MIGKTVWLQDDNNRHYEAGRSGPSYRKSFRPLVITGETRVSWLLERDWKINKSTGYLRCPSNGFFGTHPKVYWSLEEVEDACFVRENSYQIGRAAQLCKDGAVLRQIAALLGITLASPIDNQTKERPT